MIYLLDSNTCIAWLNRSHEGVVSMIESLEQDTVLICSIVLAELMFGCEKSAPSKRGRNYERVEALRFRFMSLPFDDEAALHYARIRAHLATLGSPIGPNDLMIAAIALAHDLTLVTHKTQEFGRVPGLRITDWQSAQD